MTREIVSGTTVTTPNGDPQPVRLPHTVDPRGVKGK